MKAIVVEGPGQYRLKEVPTPEIKNPDDVLVKIHAVGICGSDLHLLHGGNPSAKYPRVPGHEMTGEVIAVGNAVKNFKVGDRVIAEPLRYCGTCHACLRERRNVCEHLQIVSVHLDGGFSEYYVSPEKNLFKLPDFISYELATAIEPCTIGEQANSRADTRRGDTVLIHGAGPIGITVMDSAKRIGARVLISEPSASRRAMALDFGADVVIDPIKEDLRARVMEETKGVGPNEIFDAAGIPKLLPLSIDLVATAGFIVPMSFSTEPVAINCASLNMKEVTIAGTRHQYKKFQKVINELPERMDMLKRFVTHVYEFADYEEAIRTASDPNAGACKVVMKLC